MGVIFEVKRKKIHVFHTVFYWYLTCTNAAAPRFPLRMRISAYVMLIQIVAISNCGTCKNKKNCNLKFHDRQAKRHILLKIKRFFMYFSFYYEIRNEEVHSIAKLILTKSLSQGEIRTS